MYKSAHPAEASAYDGAIVGRGYFLGSCFATISFAMDATSNFVASHSPDPAKEAHQVKRGKRRLLNRKAEYQVLSSIRHFVLFLCALVLCSGSVLTQGTPSPSSTDRIHFVDVVEIDELGGFDFDWRGSLNPEGYLDKFTKVAEPIFALCKTPTELEELVRKAYGRTLREPRVSVRILDRSQRPLAILDGAIRQPMRLQIRRAVRLSELIVIGGGLIDRASGEISILRPALQSCEDSADSTSSISVRVNDILSGNPEANPRILPGDIVTVGVVQSVYVLGGVNRPGRIDWREGSTVSRAVASAGGVSDRGVRGKVSIFRKGPPGEKVIEADLARIVAGDEKDIEILPLDIIDVPFKGAPPQTRPVLGGPTETSLPRSLPIRVVN